MIGTGGSPVIQQVGHTDYQRSKYRSRPKYHASLIVLSPNVQGDTLPRMRRFSRNWL